MFKAFYAAFGILVLAGFSFVTWRGIQPAMGQRKYVAGGLRGAAHGGYRSFWYSGFHGGK
ncbi:MAG TPA: hypothetical protein VHU41_03160 [Thermoanaerobaculia bacterium]|jgi:hypothetical protein|nr:hypothetical protein [Thermoanaerobaculia bacterium]